MKKILTLFILTVTINAFGQTAKQYLRSGIEKQNKENFEGALLDYNNAIKADNSLTKAYFNRGAVKLALSDSSGALSDFNETIALDNSFIRAYYSRATIFATKKKYSLAVSDLDAVIDMDEKFPNALTLRGQLLSALENNEASCKDFYRAKELGDPFADDYLSKYCGEPRKGESLVLDWPENENWKTKSNKENDKMIFVELLRDNETFNNWTEMGTMQTLKGMLGMTMDRAMYLTEDQTKPDCPSAKLTFIEKDENAEHPWILFSIECGKYNSDQTAESQLWYVVQGKTGLFVNFRAIKRATIPESTKKKWIAFFKSSKVINVE